MKARIMRKVKQADKHPDGDGGMEELKGKLLGQGQEENETSR